MAHAGVWGGDPGPRLGVEYAAVGGQQVRDPMSEKTQVVVPRAAQRAHQAPGRAEEGTEAPGGRGRGALGWFLG